MLLLGNILAGIYLLFPSFTWKPFDGSGLPVTEGEGTTRGGTK